ncbi:MAG: undecaprenyl-diphosphate phosphatase [Nitrospinota bacterium]
MDFTDAVLLGLVQGLTEFLPISSSGHLVIAQHLLTGFKQPGILFDVILHFGSLIAVLLFFKKEIQNIIKGIVQGEKRERAQAVYIIAGTIPTVIIALIFNDVIDDFFHSVTLVGVMLIVTGTFLFLSGKLKKQDKSDVTLWDALIIGTVQGIAIIPGVSRSGITISAALFRKVDPVAAGRFSFLLSIPAIIGAVILEGRHLSSLDPGLLPTYLTGAIAALLSGLASIKVLMVFLKSRRFSVFAYYCWILGSLTIILL